MATASFRPRPETVLLDPVHGSIQLEPYLVKIINTPEFQRLRKIKQLGGACFVYPGATHTRFEHSIGVCHIAGHLIKELNTHPAPNEPPWNTGVKEPVWITEEEGMCIKIAALCHDLGHGPYSHVYDHVIQQHCKAEVDQKNPIIKHEYRSADIVGKKIMSDDLKQQFTELGYTKFTQWWDKYVNLIKAMIKFSEEYKKYENENTDENWKAVTADTPKTKSYLFEIVANGFTGIDVDKMDYFARDSRSVGLPNSFDWRRFTQTARIIKTPGDFYHICSRDKDAIGLYELFHTRNVLYRTVYCHKSVMIIQEMIKKALASANDVIKFRDHPLLECWKDIDAFLCLDDSIEDIIMKPLETTAAKKARAISESDKTTSKELEESRSYYDRIRKRKLPKFVGRTHLELKTDEQKDSARHDRAVCVARKNDDVPTIKRFLANPLKTKFSYGKDKDNPMESHYFYSKLYPELAYQLPPEEVSKFLPNEFMEMEWLWYYDTTEHDEAANSDPNLMKSDDVKCGMWESFNIGRLPEDCKNCFEKYYKLKKEKYRDKQDFNEVEGLRTLQAKIDEHRKEWEKRSERAE